MALVMKGECECEWMFADAATGLVGINAFAKYNPLRWSRPISFDECIKQLKEARQGEVSVKTPAGFSSKEHIFSDIASAIVFVENNDPVRQQKKREAQKAASDAELAERRAAAEAEQLEAEKLKLEAEKLLAETLEAEQVRMKKENAGYVKRHISAFGESSAQKGRREKQLQYQSKLQLDAEIKAADQARMQARVEVSIKDAEEKIAYYEQSVAETAKTIRELEAAKAIKTACKAAANDIDCEWMFGDLISSTAGWNPMRWSGALSFDVAVEKLQLEKCTRAIIVKVPAGVLSSEHWHPNCHAAIDFIQKLNPNHLQVQAEEVEATLQIAMKTMDDASNKLQEYKVEFQAWSRVKELLGLFCSPRAVP